MVSTDDKKSHVRQPVQARAKETRGRILEAAAAVFDALGYEKTTTHAIAERAGVSVGSLYAYFKDKDALVTELFDEHAAELFAIIEAPFEAIGGESFSPEAAIRTAVEASVRCHEVNPGLHRVFHSLEHHPAIEEYWEKWKAAALARLRILIDLGGDNVNVSDKDAAAFLIYHTVDSVCVRHFLYGEGPPTETVIEELTSMFLRYLIGPPTLESPAPE